MEETKILSIESWTQDVTVAPCKYISALQLEPLHNTTVGSSLLPVDGLPIHSLISIPELFSSNCCVLFLLLFHLTRPKEEEPEEILKTKNKTSKSIQVRIHGINLGIETFSFFFFFFFFHTHQQSSSHNCNTGSYFERDIE
jgi:hypothetical protein